MKKDDAVAQSRASYNLSGKGAVSFPCSEGLRRGHGRCERPVANAIFSYLYTYIFFCILEGVLVLC